MNSNFEFRSEEKEVKHLLDECAEIRRALSTMGAQISRMEKRLRLAFPSVAKKLAIEKSAPTQKHNIVFTEEQALEAFDKLVVAASSRRPGDGEAILHDFGSQELRDIARAIGVNTGNSNPSVATLRAAIIGKVRETLSLSSHTQRSHVATET